MKDRQMTEAESARHLAGPIDEARRHLSTVGYYVWKNLEMLTGPNGGDKWLNGANLCRNDQEAHRALQQAARILNDLAALAVSKAARDPDPTADLNIDQRLAVLEVWAQGVDKAEASQNDQLNQLRTRLEQVIQTTVETVTDLSNRMDLQLEGIRTRLDSLVRRVEKVETQAQATEEHTQALHDRVIPRKPRKR